MVDSYTTAQDVGIVVIGVPFTSAELALDVVLAVVIGAVDVDFLDVARASGGHGT